MSKKPSLSSLTLPKTAGASPLSAVGMTTPVPAVTAPSSASSAEKASTAKKSDELAAPSGAKAGRPKGDTRGASPGDPRKGQTLRLGAEAWKQLKRLAIDREQSAHELLIEAVNDLFRKNGLPPLA